MKLFLLFFVFFLSLGSFIAGWILKSNYEKGAFHNFQKKIKKLNFKESGLQATKNNQQQTEDLLSFNEHSGASVSFEEEPLTEDTSSLSDESFDRDNSLQKKAIPSSVNNSENQVVEEGKPEVTGKSSSSESSPKVSGDDDFLQKYREFNREEFIKTKGDQKDFFIDGRYSLLINVLSAEKSARDYVKSLKSRFPLWNFFIKPDSPQLRIYLGPFKTKNEAIQFIEKFPTPSPFPNYFLEEEGLFQ